MPYIEGFVAAVPTANKAKYIEQAREATAYFKDLVARLGGQRLLGERPPASDVARAVDDLELRRDALVELDLIAHRWHAAPTR